MGKGVMEGGWASTQGGRGDEEGQNVEVLGMVWPEESNIRQARSGKVPENATCRLDPDGLQAG